MTSHPHATAVIQPKKTVAAPQTLVAEDLPSAEMTARVYRADELAAHLERWQRLAETALEPNAFYEPCMLLPALETLAGDSELEFVVIESPSRKYPNAPPVWCGFFPLERSRRRGMPLEFRQMWKYIHCFLCLPLVRGDVADEVLVAFFKWLETEAGGGVLKLDCTVGEGPVQQLLIGWLRRNDRAFWVSNRYGRAIFRRSASNEAFLLESLPRKRRHEMRRLEKRLAEQGPLEYRSLAATDDCGPWIDEFLRLESEGWKGTKGTALGCTDADRGFFRAMTARAHASGQLMMASMIFNGQIVAIKCNILTGGGGFAFKIAFAEDMAKHSPGVLLELHNIDLLHQRDDVAWMDSCAIPDHPMIDHLWKHRRTIETLWIAGSPRRLPALTLALLPAIRWLKELLLGKAIFD